MGLFDKLKQATNFITGGGAKVTVTPLNPVNKANEAIKIRIDCEMKDSDMDINNVYLKVRAYEKVIAKRPETTQSGSLNATPNMTNANDNEIELMEETYSNKVDVTGSQALKASQTYTWEAEFMLPSNLNGTYKGKNAWHTWEILAGLDKSGNDPDSGWKEIEVVK